ncbi:MAG: hypothetical protein RMJ54_01060 [Roseiflexaceae bacterium]|nr:hypothetical protein [Roseiflexaceae bacterium]
MLVLYILVTIGIIIMVILFIFFIYMIIMLIDEHFEGKFDYNFVRTSFVMTVAVLLMLSGLHWYNESLINNGDVLNGLILMMIGGVIAIGLLSYTIWKTNLIYAILITLLQLGISPLLIVFFVVMAGLKVLSALLSPVAEPVYIVDKD